jgi:hypothetical protein
MSYVFIPGANPGHRLADPYEHDDSDLDPAKHDPHDPFDPSDQESFDPWVAVRDGGLEHPVFIRLGWSRDWQIVVTGLVINPDDPGEITSETLRSIPVARILADLIDHYQLAGTLSWPEHVDARDHRSVLHQALAVRAPRLLRESRARGGAATSDDLSRFADIYNEQRIRQPHRAMTATAEALHISRATANRWAKRCRTQGLLPPLSPPK